MNYQNSSETLLKRYVSGCESAPADFMTRYQTRIVGLARKKLMGMLKARTDPEEIAQETFIAFFDLADRDEVAWNTRGDLWRLLAGIAVNNVKQKFEYSSAAKRNPSAEAASMDQTRFDPASNDENAVIELTELVEHLLHNEKPVLRSVLELRLAGLTHDDIATRLGRSPRTIRRLIDSLKAKTLLAHELVSFNPMNSEITSPLSPANPGRESNVGERSYNEFQLLRMIGEGSFAKVYLARHLPSDELFAVKAIRKRWLASHDVREAFVREVHHLKSLNDPNVVQTFGLGRLPNGGYFLVLEFIEGQPLSIACVDATFEQKQNWIAELESTVERMHENRIVHGDLNVENVMITTNNAVKLVDFGFSLRDSESSQSKAKDLLELNRMVRLLTKEN